MLSIPEEVKEAIKRMEEEQDTSAAILVSMWTLGEFMARAERMHALADEARELHQDKNELDRLMKLARSVVSGGAASEVEDEHNARSETWAIPVPKPVGGGPASGKPNFEAN